MKTKKTTSHILALISGLSLSCSIANATVTLRFTDAAVGDIATGFANFGETSGTNGLVWGVIVDEGSNGFSANYESGFNLTNNNSRITLTGTDDVLYVNATPTVDTFFGGFVFEDDGVTNGGPGSITELSALDVTGNVGKSFGLIWFDSNDLSAGDTVNTGDNYGFFTDGSFTLPVDGTDGGGFDAVFDGVDPIRTANLAFAAPSAVPEPSSTALLGLGSLGLLLRRRR